MARQRVPAPARSRRSAWATSTATRQVPRNPSVQAMVHTPFAYAAEAPQALVTFERRRPAGRVKSILTLLIDVTTGDCHAITLWSYPTP